MLKNLFYLLWFIPHPPYCTSMNLENMENYQGVQTRRIEGGEKTTSSEHPYVVHVNARFVPDDRPQYEGFCSGSIIHESVVLTAAHCIFDNVPGSKQYLLASKEHSFIYVGSDTTKQPRASYTFWKLSTHPSYNKKFRGDIGLIGTSRSLLNSGGNVIALGGYKNMPASETFVEIFGYGWQGITEGSNNGVLTGAGMYIKKLEICKGAIPIKWARLDKRYICLVAGYNGPLVGDSGGPVVYNGTLIGVIKGGMRPSTPSKDRNDYILRYNVAEAAPFYKECIMETIDEFKQGGVEKISGDKII